MLSSSWLLLLALCIATSSADAPAGFVLDGTRWTYKDDQLSMQGILVKPDGKGPFPAILISHGLGGGAQSFGMSKAREFVQWGFVCIAPDYTHTGEGGDWAQYGASEENLRRASKCLDILESLPYVDKKRLCAYGHSMGGFVTIGLAAAEPRRLAAAAVTGSGVAPRSGFPAPSVQEAAKIVAPFCILHGTKDNVVRPEQSAMLKEALDKNKVPNERHLFDGAGHPIDRENAKDVYERIHAWFKKQGIFK